ncbi:RTA1-domain-containing protein [Clathrospora elynae]|uniref:RTA1-domain-containing protein n=1 Tax=Clathrospora elynae TaxID=706981 RepID=A0A6A5S616_9PLEO|nr:RTA1-domain-containing protein [Clathrospora elynae]
MFEMLQPSVLSIQQIPPAQKHLFETPHDLIASFAAIIFVVTFGLTPFFHIFQLIRRRTWYFIPLVVGGLFKFVGYIGHFLSHYNVWALGPFIMQSLLILVAPALFAAFIYIILGRIILLKWLTKMFVTGDIFSLLLQGSGGGIQDMGIIESLYLGERIIIGGLFVLLLFFAIFIVIAGVARRPVPRQKLLSRVHINELPWKRHLHNLYFASALIMAHGIFRVVEYIQGNADYLLTHEVYLYVFDATFMLFVMVLFDWIHPSQVTEAYLKRSTSDTTVELQRTRDELLGQDEGHMVGSTKANDDIPNGGWALSRG